MFPLGYVGHITTPIKDVKRGNHHSKKYTKDKMNVDNLKTPMEFEPQQTSKKNKYNPTPDINSPTIDTVSR